MVVGLRADVQNFFGESLTRQKEVCRVSIERSLRIDDGRIGERPWSCEASIPMSVIPNEKVCQNVGHDYRDSGHHLATDRQLKPMVARREVILGAKVEICARCGTLRVPLEDYSFNDSKPRRA